MCFKRSVNKDLYVMNIYLHDCLKLEVVLLFLTKRSLGFVRIFSGLKVADKIKKHWLIKFQSHCGYICILCLVAYLFSYHEKAIKAQLTSSLRSCRPSDFPTKMGESSKMPFPTAQQVNLPACSPHCPFKAELLTGKL